MPCDNQLNIGDLGITVKTDACGCAVEAQFDLPDGSTVIRPFPASGESMMLQLKLGIGLTCVPQAGGGGDEILEVIDFAGNEEITEYVNNDVTAVTTYIDFSDCTALTTAQFPLLERVDGDGIYFSPCEALTTIDFSSLETVGNYLSFNGSANLGVASFPALTSVGAGISCEECAALTTINCPSLTTIGDTLSFNDCGALTAVNFSSLLNAADVVFSGCGSLVTFNLPSLIDVGNVNLSGCALNGSSVDNILVKLASLDGTGDTTSWEGGLQVNVSGGTNAVPSATGLAAKATLEGRGNTVLVNS